MSEHTPLVSNKIEDEYATLLAQYSGVSKDEVQNIEGLILDKIKNILDETKVENQPIKDVLRTNGFTFI